ncbi:hypothetical protein K443DRAFT_10181 [Laccaria amethystina LaAM-08-1]|uniref:Uncharacterized protein n=1 Tax=Laccaria amethystina LaAM-08-1 TaxID=1095629 RepID=A0A0C9X6W9_9AGAR|nr:hypothetical protein K443DRAFT_10181 [Laccaria amethystina LaAM-08-1]
MDGLEAVPAQDPSQAECEMWDGFVPTEDAFEIEQGPEEVLTDAQMEFECKVKEFGAWGSKDDIEGLEGAWDEAEHDDIITEIRQNLVLENEECEETDDPSSQDTNTWHPYSSKLIFILDTIGNLPCLRISGSLMKVLLWLLKQVRVKHVPSFDTLCKVQHRVREESGIPMINWMSSKGNAFLFKDPRMLIANDWMNPLIAPHIGRYPVLPENGVTSEVWHTQKWRHDIDWHILSPMYDAGNSVHYFIDEPAILLNMKMVIPVQWLEDEKGGIWADAWEVEYDESANLSTIRDDIVIMIKATDLQRCMLNLEDAKIPIWSPETLDKGHPLHMPNPDRALADAKRQRSTPSFASAPTRTTHNDPQPRAHLDLVSAHANDSQQPLCHVASGDVATKSQRFMSFISMPTYILRAPHANDSQ